MYSLKCISYSLFKHSDIQQTYCALLSWSYNYYSQCPFITIAVAKFETSLSFLTKKLRLPNLPAVTVVVITVECSFLHQKMQNFKTV